MGTGESVKQFPWNIPWVPVAVSLALCLALAGCSSLRPLPPRPPGEVRGTIALLPFMNLSGDPDAQQKFMPVLRQDLINRGYKLLPGPQLEQFLAANRIRFTDSLTRKVMGLLEKTLRANYVMVGLISLLADSQNPQIGVTSRLLALPSGTPVWFGDVGLSGGDFTGILGLGSVHSQGDLIGLAAARLLADFSLNPAPSQSLPSKFFKLAGPRARVSMRPGWRPQKVLRVAVMPLENQSLRPGAGLIVADLIGSLLARSGRFQVVEPAELREALVELQIIPRGEMNFEALKGLRKRLGVDAVLIGRVEEYAEDLIPGRISTPRITLSARLLDTAGGEILWWGRLHRTGDDSVVVWNWGRITTMFPLVRSAAIELLRSLIAG